MEATTFVKATTIYAKGRFPLAVTRFSPLMSNGELVLIGSATAVHQPYYRQFALFLVSTGYCVYTFDYRGVGQSRPRSLKGFKANLQIWGRLDLDAVIKHIRDSHPHSPSLTSDTASGATARSYSREPTFLQDYSGCLSTHLLETVADAYPVRVRLSGICDTATGKPLVGIFPGKSLGHFLGLTQRHGFGIGSVGPPAERVVFLLFGGVYPTARGAFAGHQLFR